MLRCIHNFILPIVLFFIGFILLNAIFGFIIGLLIHALFFSLIIGILIGLALAIIVTAFELVGIIKFCLLYENRCR